MVFNIEEIVKNDSRYYGYLEKIDELSCKATNVPGGAPNEKFIQFKSSRFSSNVIAGVSLANVKILRMDKEFGPEFVKADYGFIKDTHYTGVDSLINVLNQYELSNRFRYRSFLFQRFSDNLLNLTGDVYNFICCGINCEYYNLNYYIFDSITYRNVTYYFAAKLDELEEYVYNPKAESFVKVSTDIYKKIKVKPTKIEVWHPYIQ